MLDFDLLANLPDLEEAEVAPVNLARLPPSYLFDNYLEDREDWLDYLRTIGYRFKDHSCEKCDGKGKPNPEYQPTEEDKENPCLWFVQYRTEARPGYSPLREYDLRDADDLEVIPTITVASIGLSRKSNIGKTLEDKRDSLLDRYEVFFESPYSPCTYSLDWYAFESLKNAASKLPDVVETVKEVLRRDDLRESVTTGGSWLYAVSSFNREPGRYLREERRGFNTGYELLKGYFALFEEGGLDDVRSDLRKIDFGPYPWSLDLSPESSPEEE